MGLRWTVRWKTTGADVTCPVQGLAGAPAMASVPVRGFTWRAGQWHRPGLQRSAAWKALPGLDHAGTPAVMRQTQMRS